MIETLLQELNRRNLKLACAESLTGGLLASSIVSVAGASSVILGGVVAYNTALKRELLGVSAHLLSQVGAVDPQVAIEMAQGVRSRCAQAAGLALENVIGVSTTGVAGPDNQDAKPVGLVYLAIAGLGATEAIELRLSGDREAIRAATVSAAIESLTSRL